MGSINLRNPRQKLEDIESYDVFEKVLLDFGEWYFKQRQNSSAGKVRQSVIGKNYDFDMQDIFMDYHANLESYFLKEFIRRIVVHED